VQRGTRFKFNIDALEGLSPADRARATALLAEFRDRREANPLEAYIPEPDQWAILQSLAAIVAVFGGNRSGKTTTGIIDDLVQVTPRELVPDHLMPAKRYDCPCFIRLFQPTGKLINSVLLPKLREWTPRALLKGGSFDKSWSKSEMVVRLECGCRFDLNSYDQDRDALGGSALHRVHYDEEPPEEIRKESFARLLDFNGDELFTMTPLEGMTWMYDGIYKRSQTTDRIEAFNLLPAKNPYISAEKLGELIEEWADDPATLDARLYGKFVHPPGLVYPNFQESEAEPIEQGGLDVFEEIVVGIDPGVLGFGVVFAGFTPWNECVVFEAVVLQDADVEDAADYIYERAEFWDFDPMSSQTTFVIDPAAKARMVSDKNVTVETMLADRGILCIHGQNDREAGVLEVRRRLARGMIAVAGGRNGGPAQRLHWEAEHYRIKEREDGKFDVIKVDDHALDALRYICMWRPYDPESDGLTPVRQAAGEDIAFPPPKPGIQTSVAGPGV
jgi:phage terminase large subunit-like protein